MSATGHYREAARLADLAMETPDSRVADECRQNAHLRLALAAAAWTDNIPASLDAAYRERAELVVYLTRCYPAVLSESDPAAPGWFVVYLDTPQGQMSWHIAPGDLGLFNHVRVVAPDDPRAQWDGHSAEEKYLRLLRLGASQYVGTVNANAVAVEDSTPPDVNGE